MAGKLQDIFENAVELRGSEREAYLRGACGADASLRTEVDNLLRVHEDAASFLASPTADVAPRFEDVSTVATAPSEQQGQQIGRYKLLEQLGEGGFGTVWAAEQREPVKRRVALKIIKLGMDTRQVIARFEAERQALAMMDHPNIAKVLDAGSTETGRPFFVMELVKGVPILEYCDTEKLDTKARLDLFMKVCHAIQHAHQKGIIHRDIKPTNVLVTLHDGVPVPKVIDFGIAKATNQELTEKTLYTQHRQMIGTPAYMSPEQAEMSGLDIDTRSDIYSLGVLLYELLTGTTPFAAEELMSKGFAEMMRIIREVEPHKPSTRLSSLGDTGTRTAQQRHLADPKKLGLILRGDLDWIVMKCLEKDRARRYETANGLAADIQRHLNDEPVTAGAPSTSYKLRKFVKRNRAQVVAAAIVGAVLLLGVMGTSAGMVWALREKSRANVEASRANRELARATQIKELITQMLQSVDPTTAQGADTALLKGILDDASARLSKGEITDELIAAELHHVVGDVYSKIGLYKEADAHLPKAVEVRTRVIGADHPDTLATMHNLAWLYLQDGRWDESEKVYTKVIDARKRVLGAEHPDTLLSMNGLMSTLWKQRRFVEAEKLCGETLEIRTRVLGGEHKDNIQTIFMLGVLNREQGRLAEAESFYVQALELSRRLLGEDDPKTLVARSHLAYLHFLLGQKEEAERMYLAALQASRRVMGEEHPSTLWVKSDLAKLFYSQMRLAEAEPLLLNVQEARTRALGPEHPDTLAAVTSLANLYHAQGRFAEAERMYLATLQASRRVMGEEHPSTLWVKGDLAKLFYSQMRLAEAEPLLLNVQEARTRALGPEHPDTLAAATSLASLYQAQGRFAEAEPLFLETLEISMRVLGPEHSETLRTMYNLAVNYQYQERYAEAESLYIQIRATKKRVLGEEHPETLGGITNLGLLYNMMERYEKAAKLFEESLPIKRRVLGTGHPWTQIAMNGLAESYMHLGRRDDALPLYRELIVLRTAAVETANADAQSLNNAAWILLTHDVEELRDPAKALEYAQLASKKEEAAGGPGLYSYLDTLALAQHKTGDAAGAVETQRRALSLVPADAPDRAEFEKSLAKYEEVAKGGG